jgi:hypothetical protein
MTNKSLKKKITEKIELFEKEVQNLLNLESKINEQMTKVQLGKTKAQAAILVLKDLIKEETNAK